MVKRIVCLANSRKLQGCCIAGIELAAGRRVGWIRPVSARETEELSVQEGQYPDGSDPRVLDIINVPLLEPRPRGYQQENWLIDSEHDWVRVGHTRWSDLAMFSDSDPQLWINGYHTSSGQNDKIPLHLAADLRSSLRIIPISSLVLSVLMHVGASGSRRRLQGRFRYKEMEYRLWVTDREYESIYLSKKLGEYEISECFLTVSLSEPYGDACYKLIAAIIEPPKGGQA